MGSPACRSCSGRSGNLVLDLGNQPACDHFPACHDPGPDPGYPLQMWLCSSCGLAQLVGEPTVAEEPLGTEPEALVAQAVDAVERLAAAGWLSGRSRVAEFASPHGGSWLGLLADRGLAPVDDGGPADLVIDSFGMMHDADQSAALAERVARVAPGASSCCSTTRWTRSFAWVSGTLSGTGTSRTTRPALWSACWRPRASVQGRRGGSTSTAARCSWPPAESLVHAVTPDGSVTALLSDDARLGVRDPVAVGRLQGHAEAHAQGIARLARRSANRGKERAGLRRRVACGRALLSEPGWIDGSCLRSLTRRHPNMDFACRGRTFPSSARQRSTCIHRTSCSCSYRIC